MQVKRFLAPSLLAIVILALAVQLPLAIAARTSVYEWFDPIVDIRGILLDRYVEEPDEEEMQLAMIQGMIEALDDPHTRFVPPVDTADFNKELHGVYAGIGAEVNFRDGHLVIVSPMDDSPALAAGIQAGDVVLEIDGFSTFEPDEMNYVNKLNESVEHLMGEVDTDVTLLVRHLDETEERITITRRQIVTRTIRGLRRIGRDWSFCVDPERGISYVRLSQFNTTSIRELRAALDELAQIGLNGLVLDLRDNPGGALSAAVEMADMFLTGGDIVTVKAREGTGEDVTYGAHPSGTLPEFPMIVLVNGQSASASEIVAGALQDNHRARVLGTRSFGKGSVQEVRTLRYNRGTLKYTTAHYYLPSGRNLNRSADSVEWGVDPAPGFVIPVTDEEYIAMILARREFEVIRELSSDEAQPAACVDAEWIRENIQDEQLASAVDALATRLDGGDWPAFTEIEPGEVAFSQELQRASERRIQMLEQLARLDERIGELQGLGEETGRVPLLPEDIDLTDGQLIVRDRLGNIVGRFIIQAGDLDLALEGLELTPVAEEPATD